MAFTVWNCAGVLKPCGTSGVMVVTELGGALGFGTNCAVVISLTPPVKITGVLLMVPALVLVLLMFVLMVRPPATGCATIGLKFESSTSVSTVSVVGADRVVVLKLFPWPAEPQTRIPEGARVVDLTRFW